MEWKCKEKKLRECNMKRGKESELGKRREIEREIRVRSIEEVERK